MASGRRPQDGHREPTPAPANKVQRCMSGTWQAVGVGAGSAGMATWRSNNALTRNCCAYRVTGTQQRVMGCCTHARTRWQQCGTTRTVSTYIKYRTSWCHVISNVAAQRSVPCSVNVGGDLPCGLLTNARRTGTETASGDYESILAEYSCVTVCETGKKPISANPASR